MTWSRFDDRYDDHRKIKLAMRRDPLAAALHAQAITASSRHETDGLVDDLWLEERVTSKPRLKKVLAVLVELRLFDELIAGEILEVTDRYGYVSKLGPFSGTRYVVHDYLAYNASAAYIREKRDADAGRKRKEKVAIPNGIRTESARNPNGIHEESDGTPSGILACAHGGARPAQPSPARALSPVRGGAQLSRPFVERSSWGNETVANATNRGAA